MERTASPSEHPSPPPPKRIRSAVACGRCKSRRQKCDNAQPRCTNCAKAGENCAYVGSEYPQWYVRSLEAHIATLESKLRDVDPTLTADHLDRRQAASSHDAPSPSTPNHLGTSLGFLSLLAAGEPYYLGMNGGFSLGSLVQAAIYDEGTTGHSINPAAATAEHSFSPGSGSDGSPLNLPRPEDRPFSCHVPKATTLPASLPRPELGEAFISTYLATVHRSYPFLDRDRLIALHKDVLQAGNTVSTVSNSRSRKALIKLHLVYGIGARQLQLSSGPNPSFERSLPEAHYVAAVSLLGNAFEIRGMENIELLLLLSMYSMHSPSGPGVWHLCGIALRLCVEMGLHKDVRQLPPGLHHQDQSRKRLFWSCYLLERKICITLGRPISLSDEDIDVQLPIPFEPSDNTTEPHIPATHLAHQGHLVRLQQIIFRNHRSQSGLGGIGQTTELDSKRALLEQWYQSVKGSETEEALSLEYYKALRVMIQPYVVDPSCDPNTVAECARVAGAVCQSYKRLHQDETMGMYLLEVHDILLAGITLIWCARLRPDILNPYIVSTDLGAASTVLFLVATRWVSAKKYRDAFECLVAKTMEYITAHQANGLHANQPTAQVDLPCDAGMALWESGVDDDIWRMLTQMTGMPDTSMSMEGDPGWMKDIAGWDNGLRSF